MSNLIILGIIILGLIIIFKNMVGTVIKVAIVILIGIVALKLLMDNGIIPSGFISVFR